MDSCAKSLYMYHMGSRYKKELKKINKDGTTNVEVAERDDEFSSEEIERHLDN